MISGLSAILCRGMAGEGLIRASLAGAFPSSAYSGFDVAPRRRDATRRRPYAMARARPFGGRDTAALAILVEDAALPR